MTGFGRAENLQGEMKFIVEMKAVNHRYFDVNIKMPKKLAFFESAIRSTLKNYMHRGKIDVFITYEDLSQSNASLKYNEKLAAEYLQYYRQMAEKFGLRDDITVSAPVSYTHLDVYKRQLYTQINYQDKPVRVTPLVYASPIKWMTNQKNGIPAYIMIDMATQDTSLVKLDKPIKYSESEYFNRNIYRHLRFHYPTYIFDSLSFEIDDEGTPYWICPVKKYNVGLFGGVTIGRVVICNAQTGEMKDYAIEDCPTWVDRVYSADLLVQLYDYYGTLKNGYLNSILGQKGCLRTTAGYNYLAIDDDVWVYTGVTSVSGDQSNVGFVLMNQRTMECRFYSVAGAEEFSAMASAEGQVQNLGYTATFPLLLNVSGEPTYFMALKDGAGLVKKYAMVNIQKYQNVSIGDTVAECKEAYNKLLKENGIAAADEMSGNESVTGKITKIVDAVVEGNSHIYLMLDNKPAIYDVNVAELLEIIRYNVNDKITLRYLPGETVNTVVALE